jgi:eukaryotic-like serine/threonine-protein kinase
MRLLTTAGLLVTLAATQCAVAAAGSSPPIASPGLNWTQFRGGARHTGANPFETTLGAGNVAGLGAKWQFQVDPNLASSPVVANGVVYFGTQADRSLYALSEDTGALLWKARTGGFVDGTPAVAGNLVLVGAGDGKLYAFRTSDGSLAWSATIGSEILSSPAVSAGVVYVGSDDGAVYAFRAASGTMLWRAVLGGTIDASPTVAYGSVFVGSTNGSLFAIDATTGAQRWSYGSGGRITGSAAVRRGDVYAGSAGGSLFALDAATGAVIWTRRAGGAITSSPAALDGVLYFTLVTGGRHAVQEIEARRQSSGRLLWSNAYGNLLGGGFIGPSPTVANGVVYAGFLDGSVRALDASSGAVLWEYADSPFFASPAVVEGQVFITGGGSGTVFDFSLPAR